MASNVVRQKPAVDYFSLTTSRPEVCHVHRRLTSGSCHKSPDADLEQNTSFNSSPYWGSSPYDFSLPSPESSDSIDHSPTLSSTSYPTYNLPSSTEDISKDQV